LKKLKEGAQIDVNKTASDEKNDTKSTQSKKISNDGLVAYHILQTFFLKE